jgi:nucleotide-binding universal stress UspA family protein
MSTDNKVLACVDRSHFARTVADAAVWVATRVEAPLEFLHIIDRHPEIGSGEDHSGAIGFDAQEHLLQELAARDAASARLAREQGRLFLNDLRQRAAAAGVAGADVRLRHGGLEQTLIEHQAGVRMFVLGRQGESAEHTPRPLGGNVERVVRALHKPILTVTEDFRPPRSFMLAFDGGMVTRRGVEMIAASPLLKGIPGHILMSGKARQGGPKQLEWARATLHEAGFEITAAIVPGEAEAVIAREVAARGVDLLIMGAFNHNPLRSLLFGCRTTQLLRAATVPTLLLR